MRGVLCTTISLRRCQRVAHELTASTDCSLRVPRSCFGQPAMSDKEAARRSGAKPGPLGKAPSNSTMYGFTATARDLGEPQNTVFSLNPDNHTTWAAITGAHTLSVALFDRCHASPCTHHTHMICVKGSTECVHVACRLLRWVML